MAATLTDLITNVRQASDTVNNTGMVTDTWLTWVVNNAIADAWDILVTAYQRYGVLTHPFTIAGSATTFDLSTLTSGFYKDVGLDWYPNGAGTNSLPRTIYEIGSFAERNITNERRYFISGSTLYLYPPSGNVAGDYQLWYTPNPPRLVNGTDQIPVDMDRWREIIELSGAIMVMNKREMDGTAIERRLAAVTARAKGAAANRTSQPTLIPIRGGERVPGQDDSFITSWGV